MTNLNLSDVRIFVCLTPIRMQFSKSTFYRWVHRIRDGIPDSVKEEAPTLADLAEAK